MTAPQLPAHAPRNSTFNRWTVAFVFAMLALIVIAALLGLFGYRDLNDLQRQQDDAGWTIFQMGFEHERLLLAAETGASEAEIRLRGDIYLSRVFLLRDAPMLATVREAMNEQQLLQLFTSAQNTDDLIDKAGTTAGRDALLAQLRQDARPVRELMIDMSNLNRQLQNQDRTRRTQSLLFYLAALESLMLALLGLGVLVLRTTAKLNAANLAVAEQLETQEAILRSVDDVIIGLCPCGEVLYSNPRAVELLGPSARSGSVLDTMGEGATPLTAEVKSLADTPDPSDKGYVTRKVSLDMPEGQRHYLMHKYREISAKTRHCADTSLIISISDVTLAEEASQRRDEYDARIGEMSRLLAYAAISGGIVHEISQPLAAIRNYVYALKVSLKLRPDTEEQRVVADHLGVEVDRAIEVVRNVRRMGPQDPHDPGICDIREAIDHSMRLVTLGRNPPPPIAIDQRDKDIWVKGSLPLIGQVIVNLLKNALSASAAAGRPGASIRVSAENGFALIEVVDYGSGVSEDAAKTIFTPFSKSARGGMGLGLAICQRIASTLGGSLSWKNSDSGGAVFTFTVPLEEEDQKQ
ncbi:sensor histidine kinase [Aestuariivirga sp.]|uniref:sensor histidine kinase n=1 Tax=Aestuariivirga sp. TaxID=2650926 RepID=UPI0035B4B2D4